MAAMGNSLPFCWEGELSDLPEGGWDWVFLKAVEDHTNGVTSNIQSAIQIAMHPDYQSQGLSTKMVQAMRGIAKSKGFKHLVAPVRPNQKSNIRLSVLMITSNGEMRRACHLMRGCESMSEREQKSSSRATRQ
jgi:GNAT superfamily N-acetyltransferase